jgi:hypothetical protein
MNLKRCHEGSQELKQAVRDKYGLTKKNEEKDGSLFQARVAGKQGHFQGVAMVMCLRWWP